MRRVRLCRPLEYANYCYSGGCADSSGNIGSYDSLLQESPDIAAAEAGYNQMTTLAFLNQCAFCRLGGASFGGTIYTWMPATSSQSEGGTIKMTTGYWGVSLDQFLSTAGNFASGAADALTLRPLILGATKYPSDAVVNTNSTTYSIGSATGATIRDTLVLAAIPTAGALANGKYGSLFGRGGKAFFNSGWIRFGWYWSVTQDAIGLRIGEYPTLLHIPFLFP